MTKWYEVRRERNVEDKPDNSFTFQEYVIESSRIDKKAAELDVDLLGMLGKKCWIVEIEL